MPAIIDDDTEIENGFTENGSFVTLVEDPSITPIIAPLNPVDTTLADMADLAEIASGIEALLFVSDKPLSSDKLRELLGPHASSALFKKALEDLRTRYQKTRHGIELLEVAGGWQFRTKAAKTDLIKRLSKVQTQRLSSGAMESLAIVAYRQPVMKDDIDKVRGVDSSYFIKTLLDRKLIQIAGRSELPGRPMLYATTREFLELFGLKDLSHLPSLRELEQMIPASEAKKDEIDPRLQELRNDESVLLYYNPTEDEAILKQMKETITSITTTTPYIDEQKALEKQALALVAAQNAAQTALDTDNPTLTGAPLSDITPASNFTH